MRCPTLSEIDVLASETRQRFMLHVRTTSVLAAYHLVRIARSSHSPQMCSAALRNLVCRAPIEVTSGRPYPEKRRLVRAHYEG